MRLPRLTSILTAVLALTVSVSTTSCGGSEGTGDSDLVLVGFNMPNLAGIPLNQPMIFTFSNAVAPQSITPDTLRVIGDVDPDYTTVVDGNLVALLPTVPNFEDYSDNGLGAGVTYTVSMPTFPAPATIATPSGKPLITAESFTFITLPNFSFIEPRRAIVHGVPPSQGGRSDDEGCLQNPSNTLFTPPGVVQTGSGAGATLLCLINEGSPRVIETESFPRHDARNIGTPSAVQAGLLDLPAIRVKLNEPLDPLSVVPFVNPFGVNVQLWRVAQKDGTAIVPPEQVPTNKPLISQTNSFAEIILTAAGPQLQGYFMVNLVPSLRDLPGNPLQTTDRPNPAIGGYDVYEAGYGAAVPPGYRIYFRSLALPDTPQAINESFGTNLRECGDLASAATEPGLYTESVPDATNMVLDGNPLSPFATGNFTLLNTATRAGQSTTANWNSGTGTGYRFLNIPSLFANTEGGGGLGVGKAVWEPHFGTGADLVFDSSVAPNSGGPGDNIGLNTDTGSANGDGIYEYQSFYLQAGDTITVQGGKPLLIMCQGDFIVEGSILLDGADGGDGFDTDGTAAFANAGSLAPGGIGGAGGPGGGAGGNGGDPIIGTPNGAAGSLGVRVDGDIPGLPAFAGGGGVGADTSNSGGGGGGHGNSGNDGTNDTGATGAAGGSAVGDPLFSRPVTDFEPDRGYWPQAGTMGGTGGGGGGLDDDGVGDAQTGNTTVENNDDGGAGGGGGGGSLWVIARGVCEVRSGALISANGGDGGDTYAVSDVVIDTGEAGDADDVVVSITTGTPSGEGGPGGAGAGGGICLIGRNGCTVFAGATIQALGGTGGACADPDRVGGDGAFGRILLMDIGGTGVTNSGTTSPVATTGTHVPTIDDVSALMTCWIDLFSPSADFLPLVNGSPATPDFNSNFAFLEQTLTRGPAGDFDLVWEFQGASDLAPAPGGANAPSTADGLTAWVPIAGLDALDQKRFIRTRMRFFVNSATYPGHNPAGAATGALPMPQVLDFVIPYAIQ